MIKPVNLREIALGILQEITEEEAYSHVVLREVLEKYQYLEKRDRAFISRVVEGTLEHMIQLDYIIEQFSNVPVYNMKPMIRNLLRMSVYQLKYMDSVPDSAVCNEAVKIAQKKGFYNLKGFVNGVLRNTARRLSQVKYPDAKQEPLHYLSVKYSFPIWMLSRWVSQFGYEVTERICRDSHMEKGTTVRCDLQKASKEEIIQELKAEGITVREHPYLDYALVISDYNYMKAISAFKKGWIQVQDISSMLVAEIAAPNWGDYCIDVCAAPGGKSLHISEKLMGSGYVEARDISEYKVGLMQENIERSNAINIRAVVKDATVPDGESHQKADIVLADVPCSGLGVIGKKQDIKYKMSEKRQQDIIRLQRSILQVVQDYVRPGGVLIYSTCTIGADENQYNLKWFLENFPFRLESIDPYICRSLRSKTTKGGYIQLLPGIHESDGFFIARLRRLEEAPMTDTGWEEASGEAGWDEAPGDSMQQEGWEESAVTEDWQEEVPGDSAQQEDWEESAAAEDWEEEMPGDLAQQEGWKESAAAEDWEEEMPGDLAQREGWEESAVTEDWEEEIPGDLAQREGWEESAVTEDWREDMPGAPVRREDREDESVQKIDRDSWEENPVSAGENTEQASGTRYVAGRVNRDFGKLQKEVSEESAEIDTAEEEIDWLD